MTLAVGIVGVGRRLVQVGFMRRYDPGYRALRQKLDRGQTASGVHIDVELFVNCGFGYDIRCEVVGESGTVSLTNPAPVSLRSAGVIAEPVCADWRDRFAGAYDTELREWVSNAAAGLAAGPSAWDGYAAAAIAEAALRARASGQRVPVVLADRPDCYGPS